MCRQLRNLITIGDTTGTLIVLSSLSLSSYTDKVNRWSEAKPCVMASVMGRHIIACSDFAVVAHWIFTFYLSVDFHYPSLFSSTIYPMCYASDVCYHELHMISRFTVWITVSAIRAAHPVGWPPVRASRKNIASANLVRAAEMDGEKDAKRPKLGEGEAAKSEIRSRSTMFVKVNMEGYVFGRKIDLKAHDGYQSLSRALCKLFRNFLSCT